MHPTTAILVRRVANRERRRVAERWALAALHLNLLAEYGRTQDTCPVCVDCPDWINHPPRRHP